MTGEMPFITAVACIIGVMALTTIAMLAMSVRVVPENRRLEVYRLGRPLGRRGPGLVLLIPLIDRGELVDA